MPAPGGGAWSGVPTDLLRLHPGEMPEVDVVFSSYQQRLSMQGNITSMSVSNMSSWQAYRCKLFVQETALDQNKARGRRVPAEVIINTAARMDVPAPQAHTWEAPVLTFKSNPPNRHVQSSTVYIVCTAPRVMSLVIG